MSAKKTRRGRRPQYRATTAARAASLPPEAFVDIAQSVKEVVENEEQSTRPLSAVADPSASAAQRPDEPPTVILTPAQVALLSKARPPQTVVPTSEAVEGDGYAFSKRDDRPEADAPTIILNVNDLLAMSAPSIEAPMPPPPLPAMPAPAPHTLTPTRKRELPPLTGTDRDAELAMLRRQRLARENGEDLAAEPGITGKLREWWDVMQPGIDRVLGRTHRAGSRGARATIYQTSAQLPVVTVRPSEGGDGPSLQRLSQTARAIGERAQTAARPALEKVHSRAEQLAQGIVDRIDERFGGRPPLQHVLLGPGRMIVSFSPNITIRDAQTIIATAQARSLRRIVGYNAYLVMVPPGREARYADRLHRFRQVTGVHFGPQRPAQLPSTRESEAI